MSADKRTAHARTRAKERYGLTLTAREVIDLGKRVDDFLKENRTIAALKDVVLVKRDLCFPETDEVLIKHGGRWLRVVYSPPQQAVLTILPESKVPFKA